MVAFLLQEWQAGNNGISLHVVESIMLITMVTACYAGVETRITIMTRVAINDNNNNNNEDRFC